LFLKFCTNLLKICQKIAKNIIHFLFEFCYFGKGSGEEKELEEEEADDWWLLDQVRLRRNW
jgi:hypothetical protein